MKALFWYKISQTKIYRVKLHFSVTDKVHNPRMHLVHNTTLRSAQSRCDLIRQPNLVHNPHPNAMRKRGVDCEFTPKLQIVLVKVEFIPAILEEKLRLASHFHYHFSSVDIIVSV